MAVDASGFQHASVQQLSLVEIRKISFKEPHVSKRLVAWRDQPVSKAKIYRICADVHAEWLVPFPAIGRLHVDSKGQRGSGSIPKDLVPSAYSKTG